MALRTLIEEARDSSQLGEKPDPFITKLEATYGLPIVHVLEMAEAGTIQLEVGVLKKLWGKAKRFGTKMKQGFRKGYTGKACKGGEKMTFGVCRRRKRKSGAKQPGAPAAPAPPPAAPAK